MRYAAIISVFLILVVGCEPKKKPVPYGREGGIYLPGDKPQIWGVAPVINLSGEDGVDPLIQADLLYQQLQPVQGITVVPVDRVVAVYQALHIDRVQSEDQARAVCQALALDGLLVATVTTYDPYNPPKCAVALQLFQPGQQAARAATINARDLAESAAPPPGSDVPTHVNFVQVVGMYDATNGSVRDGLKEYAHGRYDPQSPLGGAEYYLSMDRYCGFVYHDLIHKLFQQPQLNPGG